MADTPTSYRIWQSPEGILIQAGGSSIELSVADALTLAAEIEALAHNIQTRMRARWTPEISAECVRLYVDEKQGYRNIGKALGASSFVVRFWLRKAGVKLRPTKLDMRAVRAAKRSAA